MRESSASLTRRAWRGMVLGAALFLLAPVGVAWAPAAEATFWLVGSLGGLVMAGSAWALLGGAGRRSPPRP